MNTQLTRPVLIISEPGDPHALAVSARLEQKYSCDSFIWDSARYPLTDKISQQLDNQAGSSFILESTAVGRRNLSEYGAIWWRRPRPAHIGNDISAPFMRNYCQHESRRFFRGVLESLDVPIFNKPYKEQRASRKALQLQCALSAGLSIPKTLMSNSPAEVKKFYNSCDKHVVFKPFGAPPVTFYGTQLLKESALEGLDLLRNSPVIFQQLIPPHKDIRVTVVGSKLFAAENSSKLLDWRFDQESIWEQHNLPEQIVQKIFNLMSLLELDFGSLDFRLDREDNYIFFEINPNGQFLFLEIDDAELQISGAFADFLYLAANQK